MTPFCIQLKCADDSTIDRVSSKPQVWSSTLDYDRDDEIEVNFVQKWLHEQRRSFIPRNNSLVDGEFRIYHRGVEGLGHDQVRFLAIFHFTRKLGLKNFCATLNPMCGEDMFYVPACLFGPGPIVVSPPPSFANAIRSINNVSFFSGGRK